MATKSVTTVTPFDHMPVAQDHLFEVRGGLDASLALSRAEILSNVVQSMLLDAVEDDMDGDKACVCAFLMDTAKALRVAAGATA